MKEVATMDYKNIWQALKEGLTKRSQDLGTPVYDRITIRNLVELMGWLWALQRPVDTHQKTNTHSFVLESIPSDFFVMEEPISIGRTQIVLGL